MSNFLLRMVTRAAGLAPTNGPRPRTETPGFWPPDPPASPAHEAQLIPTRRDTGMAPAPREPLDVRENFQGATYRADLRQPVLDQPAPASALAVSTFNTRIHPVPPLPARERLEAPRTREAAAEISNLKTRIDPVAPLPANESPEAPRTREAALEISNQPAVAVNPEIRHTLHEVHTTLPVQVASKSVRRTDPTPATPTSVLVETQETPRVEEDTNSAQPSLAQTPAPLPRRSPRPQPIHAVVEPQEPPVEVKIGRVEVHMEAAPAPPAAPRPQGFAEYAALRRYQARPWDFRNR